MRRHHIAGRVVVKGQDPPSFCSHSRRDRRGFFDEKGTVREKEF